MKRHIRLRPALESSIVFSTEARGLSGETTLSRIELQGQEEVQSVALSQPHRKRQDNPKDERLESPLGRLCLAQRWHSSCFDAGKMYGNLVRNWRRVQGFHVHGFDPHVLGGEPLTEAMKEKYRLALETADQELRPIKLRLPSLMADLCYHDQEPNPANYGIIGGGLVRLAVYRFGLRKIFHDPA